jgi:hypothetical protein
MIVRPTLSALELATAFGFRHVMIARDLATFTALIDVVTTCQATYVWHSETRTGSCVFESHVHSILPAPPPSRVAGDPVDPVHAQRS